MKFILLALLSVLALSSADESVNSVNIPTDYPATNYSFDFWYRYLMALQQAQKTFYEVLYNNNNVPIETNFIQPIVSNLKPIETLQPVIPVTKPQCQPIGAYCVYHDDCCSGSCLSYLAKCVS